MSSAVEELRSCYLTDRCGQLLSGVAFSIKNMKDVLLVLLGGVGGFAIHALSMTVSFKQRTIENKIKVYDALIGVWVRMRNYIYTHHRGQPVDVVLPNIAHEFDQIYGSSQQLIGEAILVCEDDALTTDVNDLNEKLYRTEWHKLEWSAVNQAMEQIKVQALAVVGRMREDIKRSTRFEWRDFSHMLSGFARRRTAAHAVAADDRPKAGSA